MPTPRTVPCRPRSTASAHVSHPSRPRLWDGTDLKPGGPPEVDDDRRPHCHHIGNPWLAVDSVEIFGSNASYEYDDASDFGIHVFTHSAAIPAAQLLGLLALLNDDVERRQEGRITFNGVPVEVTFHGTRGDTSPAATGAGYSMSQTRWIEDPVQQPDRFDRTQMATDMKTYIGKFNELRPSTTGTSRVRVLTIRRARRRIVRVPKHRLRRRLR